MEWFYRSGCFLFKNVAFSDIFRWFFFDFYALFANRWSPFLSALWFIPIFLFVIVLVQIAKPVLDVKYLKQTAAVICFISGVLLMFDELNIKFAFINLMQLQILDIRFFRPDRVFYAEKKINSKTYVLH